MSVGERDLRFFAEHMCFSIEKAIRDLEYKPSHTPEEAVIETALWAAENTGCKFYVQGHLWKLQDSKR